MQRALFHRLCTPSLLLLPLLLWLSVLLAPGRAAAQEPAMRPLGGEPPTRGVVLPDPSLVSTTGAAAVEVNPAALAHTPGWSVLLQHSELRSHGRVYGGGNALLGAVPIPMYPSLVVGAGVQWLRPASSMGYEDAAKLSLAVAWRLRHLLSVGLGYHVFFTHGPSPQNHLQTLDLGLTVRPWDWLGAALVVRDLTGPLYDDLPLQRAYELEVTGRPLSTDRLEVSAGVRITERRGEVDPRFRLAGEPLDGVRVYAGVELLRRDWFRDGAPEMDVRATAGLSLHLEQVSMALTALFGREMPRARRGPLALEEAGEAFHGLGVTLQVEGARRRPMVQTDRRLLVVKLHDELDERHWVGLVTLLREAERRADVRGVLLAVADLPPGWARVQELRGLLLRLRGAGKRTYAYLSGGGTRAYYLAAAADRVLLDPATHLGLAGLAARVLFFKGTLDKLGVKADVERIAAYKSAPEVFTRETASDPARKVREAVLDDQLGRLVGELATDRKKTPAQVRELLDQGPFTAKQALSAGLVDELVAAGDLEGRVRELSGATPVQAGELRRRSRRFGVGPAVAVVLVEGDIVQGESTRIPLLGQRLVGDRTVVGALRQARQDSDVQAVVLRVASSGGSAVASEHIWGEVKELARVKPVVVSMGDSAASGGYFVSAAATRIFASPGTITGSIGIFGGKVALGGLMEKLGVTIDTHQRGKHALLGSWHRPYTDTERKALRENLRAAYDAFVGAVAEGRDMKREAVEERARGRVWTGAQAVEQGLVDELGGLLAALEDAKRRGGLDPDRPVRIKVWPEEKKGLLQHAVDLLTTTGAAGTNQQIEQNLLLSHLRKLLRAVPAVLLRAAPGESLARMPYELLLGE